MREDRAVPVLPSPNISVKLVLKEGGGLGVGCEPVWPSGKAGKQRDLGSNPLRLSFLFVTLSLTINKTLKWLSSLPTLIQESFLW